MQNSAPTTVRRDIVLVIDLLPSVDDINEAQWTSEWLQRSNFNVETQIFRGIDGCWPTESELTECLAVVITGSTCSCVNNYPHTEPLFTFFKTIIQREIPLLAICYSAQMLVRWLAGKENVIRLPEPHIGFVRIETFTDDDGNHRFPLLKSGVNGSLIYSSAQSDGFILPDERTEFLVQVGSAAQKTRFIHGASATKWKYQAFQLWNLPIWGVQFHPNWPTNGAEIVFRIVQSHNPNVVVEREGTVDEDERHLIACEFLTACHHHMTLIRDRIRPNRIF